jgi:hypothetical protein
MTLSLMMTTDALKLTRLLTGQVSPLSGLRSYVDKFGHPFIEVMFEDAITFSFAQEGKTDRIRNKIPGF